MSDTSLPIFRREILMKAFNGELTLVSAFEQLVAYVEGAAQGAIVGAGAAGALAVAPIVTLEPVEGWGGARQLRAGTGVTLADDGSHITASVNDLVPHVTGGFGVTLIVTGATALILPTGGTVLTLSALSALVLAAGDYADDAAAAAGGVAVGGLYRSGSVPKFRIT